MPDHAVVTGVGSLTPLGTDAAETWQALLATKSGITQLSRFDPTDTNLRATLAGEVTGDLAAHPAVDPTTMGRYAQLAVVATIEALDDAALDPDTDGWPATRAGVSIASGLGGIAEVEAAVTGARIKPQFTIRHLANLAAGHVSQHIDARGPTRTPATACAAGTHAIADALADIQAGRAEVMIAGGTEAPLTPTAMRGFDAMRALSTRDAPTAASCPFDADRDGFVMAEGAGMLILEAPSHAAARDVTPMARITGAARTADAHHPTRPPADARGLRRCLIQALENANRVPSSVDHINAHATGTPRGDAREATAFDHVFSAVPPTTAIKSMTGHTLGASGAIEAVVATQAVSTGTRPPTANYAAPDPDCDIPVVTAPQSTDAPVVLSTSAGFGGTNGALVIESPAA